MRSGPSLLKFEHIMKLDLSAYPSMYALHRCDIDQAIVKCRAVDFGRNLAKV